MDTQKLDELRQQMVMEISAITTLVGNRIGKYNIDPAVLEIMGKVARHEFVPVEIQPYAYRSC